MSKPKPRLDESDGKLIFLDSDDEEDELEEENEEDEDEEDYWDTKPKIKEVENMEDEPFSYSWRLMRLAAIKLAKAELKRIACIAGIEMAGKIYLFDVYYTFVFLSWEASKNWILRKILRTLPHEPIS